FTYTPAANFNGTDSFTYKASDGTDDSNVATVTITVTAVNDPPVAVDDTATTPEDTALTLSQPDLKTNDTDVDNTNAELPVTAVTQGADGTVTFTATGVTYTPNANFTGTDSFTYTVADDGTTNGVADPKTAIATIHVTVTEINDAPTANPDSKSTAEDTVVG